MINKIAIAAVAISTAVMLLTVFFVNGFQKEVSAKVYRFWSHVHVQPFGLSNGKSNAAVFVHQDFYDEPKEHIPEFKYIHAVGYKGGLIVGDEDMDGLIFKGLGDDYNWDRFDDFIVEGKTIQSKPTNYSKDLLVSESTAKRLNLKLNDKVLVSFFDDEILQLRDRRLTIVGIYKSGMEEFDKRYAIVDLALIQRLNDWSKDTVGGFEIGLQVTGNIDQQTKHLYKHLSNPSLNVLSIHEVEPAIFDWLGMQKVTKAILLFFMTLIAIINMATALIIMIIERTQMIGILKAIGARNRLIRAVFLANTLVIICFGLLIGNVIGIGLAVLQDKFSFIQLDETSYYLSVAPVDINILSILLINATVLLISLAVLSIPSLLVKRINTVEALRYS